MERLSPSPRDRCSSLSNGVVVCSFGRRSRPRKDASTASARAGPCQSPPTFLGCCNGFVVGALRHRPRTCALPISSWSSRCFPSVSLAQTNSHLLCQTSILRGSSPPELASLDAHYGEYSPQRRQRAFSCSTHGFACRGHPLSWVGSPHADEESLETRECCKSPYEGLSPCVSAAPRHVDSREKEGPVLSRSLHLRRRPKGPPSKTHTGCPSSFATAQSSSARMF